MRKHPWLSAIVAPIFSRELWHPCRESAASGLGIGLFVAMLPIPGQMLLAALGAMKLRANVAIAIAACWVTNPATQIFIMRQQELFGRFLHDTVGFPRIPFFSKFEGKPPPIMGIEFEMMNAGSFITGFLMMGIVLFLLAFPLVYLISALMPRLLPKTRYQRAKAKVIARQKKETQNPSR
jgi:uncharacterized protein (DUF2062 family)